VAQIDEPSVQVVPIHPWHIHVCNEATGFAKPIRAEKIRCRPEGFDFIANCSHEPSQGFEMRLVIVNDRD
jgi:hypothetical protein